jgi:hypothetical protein
MKAVIVSLPERWTLERDGGDLLIKVNGWTYATLHYNYSYTSNAEQWNVAREIVKLLGKELEGD